MALTHNVSQAEDRGIVTGQTIMWLGYIIAIIPILLIGLASVDQLTRYGMGFFVIFLGNTLISKDASFRHWCRQGMSVIAVLLVCYHLDLILTIIVATTGGGIYLYFQGRRIAQK